MIDVPWTDTPQFIRKVKRAVALHGEEFAQEGICRELCKILRKANGYYLSQENFFKADKRSKELVKKHYPTEKEIIAIELGCL